MELHTQVAVSPGDNVTTPDVGVIVSGTNNCN